MNNIEILLGKNSSVRSINEENKIKVDIVHDIHPLGNEMLVDTFNEEEQYVKENDASNKYRLIFTINPICSNVLFNTFTEIVYQEGSDECIKILSDGDIRIDSSKIENYNKYTGRYNTDVPNEGEKYKYVNRETLLRDTGYSHANIGPMVYHCGYDIFNNHTLRQKVLTSINKINTNNEEGRVNFNTIKDSDRDIDGKVTSEIISRQFIENNIIKLRWTNNRVNLHKYKRDDIYSFKEAIRENLIEQNGWIGFENKVSIPMENYSLNNLNATLNKTMNNNKLCEFMDMYPDRSLFSFLPKENKYKHRYERNWNYCLTYPYKKDEEHLLVKAKNNSGETIFNGLQTYIYAYDTWNDKNGKSHLYEDGVVTLNSYVQHNLSVGDKIRICLFFNKPYGENGAIYKVLPFSNIEIVRLGYAGEDNEHKFAIKTEWLQEYLIPEADEEGEDKFRIVDIRFAKIVDGVQCKYYFRKFRMLPNFKETDVNVNDEITEEELGEGNEYGSSLNRLAFSRNIFGDQEAQIVFNDDIDTTGIVDHLNRPLSEIYLTIIKNNRGWKKWYYSEGNDEVEFSHCFGKVTEGLDLIDEIFDYNIHCLHNVNIDNEGKVGGYENVWGIFKVSSLEDKTEGVTYEGLKEGESIYGDLVEFHPSTFTETVIEDVYHRFNTVQREYTPLDKFELMTYDEIYTDDYEIKPKKDGEGRVMDSASTFEVKRYEFTTNEEINANGMDNTRMPIYRVNINPEGYYYKPHYRIKLKEYENVVNVGYHTKVYFALIESGTTDEKTYFTIKAMKSDIEINEEISRGIPSPNICKDYYFAKGDVLYLYDSENGIEKDGTITNIEGCLNEQVTFFVNSTDCTFDTIIKPNEDIPLNAYEFRDGSGKFVWRNFKSCNEINEGSELYDRVFTNGAHYVHENVNFYVKRQDPTGIYGLSLQDSDYQELLSLIIKGDELEVDDLKSEEEKNDSGTC